MEHAWRVQINRNTVWDKRNLLHIMGQPLFADADAVIHLHAEWTIASILTFIVNFLNCYNEYSFSCISQLCLRCYA